MGRILATWIGACLLLLSTSLASASQHLRPVVLIVGDSLSSAYRIPQSTAWPALVQRRLDEAGLPYSVHNASRKGETTADALGRIDRLLEETHPAVVVLELGANDGLRRYPLDDIAGNLDQLVRKIRGIGAAPLIVGMRLPPNYPESYAAGFAAIFHELADRHNAAYVPFLLEDLVRHPEYFLSDRLHPNAKGQPILMETIWTALLPILTAATTAMP